MAYASARRRQDEAHRARRGIGIAPDEQDKIWQRFWQADASRSENSGSGLGLPLVKEIAELHGGSVSVESAPGSGSCFTVII